MATNSTIHALFLAEDDSSLALDRKVLRQIGVTQTQLFVSGRKALDYLQVMAGGAALAANGADMTSGSTALVDVIICNERLADMTGLRFLSHVRSLSGLEKTPALFLVSNTESTVALAARATNSCAVLARPYTLDQAQSALKFASSPQALHAPLVLPPSFIDRFAPRPTVEGQERSLRKPLSRELPQNRGDAALKEGLAALQRGDLATADKLLHGCHKLDPGRVETCLALSRLYSVQHKEREELQWLCKAGLLCLKRGERTRAQNIFSRLPRGKMGQDPLLFEAGFALQEGECKAAAFGFMEAYRLDPSKPLHALIGRTCMFTPAPEEHMRDLVQALSKAGHEATASKLHWRLFQPQKEEEEAPPGFLDNFPLLSDILSVATHTFKTWRSAA